jgi:hypothetical protein
MLFLWTHVQEKEDRIQNKRRDNMLNTYSLFYKLRNKKGKYTLGKQNAKTTC